MARTIESAHDRAVGSQARAFSKARELLTLVPPNIDRVASRFESPQNIDPLFEKIKKKAGLNLPAKFTSGIPPTGEPLGVKMDRVSASTGEKFVWFAGKVLTAVLILGWVIVPYAILVLLGLLSPF